MRGRPGGLGLGHASQASALPSPAAKSKWRWQDLTGKAKGDAPSARAGHTMTLVEHGGEQALFVIGGFSEREYRADVYKLDITPGARLLGTGDTAVLAWTLTPSLPLRAGSTKTWTLCLPASASGLESLKGTVRAATSPIPSATHPGPDSPPLRCR